MTGVMGITLGHPLVLSDAVAVTLAAADAAEETGVASGLMVMPTLLLLLEEEFVSDLT